MHSGQKFESKVFALHMNILTFSLFIFSLVFLVKLPILSTGEGVGRRVCLCEGVSSVSGGWRVEECGGGTGEEGEEEGERVRRLVFVKTSHLVQTEMRLRPGKYDVAVFCPEWSGGQILPEPPESAYTTCKCGGYLPVSGGQLTLVMAQVTTTNHCGQNTVMRI